MEQLKTPVAIIVFKRLDTTKKMFETVLRAQPKELFIIADGWRNEGEEAKCKAVRDYLETAIDWPCTLYKNYSDVNLGTKKRIVSGLDWVFEKVEEAIILEDDTVPDVTFFRFCQELLEKYRNEPRVMQIAGLNIQSKNRAFDTQGASYYFSQFPEIWGWATWRRAWKLFDANMQAWPEAKKSKLLEKSTGNVAAADYWEHLFDTIYRAGDDRKKSDVWAAQWVFAHVFRNGVSIQPAVNLVSNIGEGEGATRAKGTKGNNIINLPVHQMQFPLTHPSRIFVNEQADDYTLREGFKIKRRLTEKALFFLKRHASPLHAALKRFKR